MRKLGSAASAVILCDDCKKRISVKGIRMQEKESGEYRVQFFTCSRCGALYQVNTTDEKQRELLEKRSVANRRLQMAAGHRFREKTVKGYRKEVKEAEQELKERAPMLREIGDKILKDGGNGDGQKNGDRRAESV